MYVDNPITSPCLQYFSSEQKENRSPSYMQEQIICCAKPIMQERLCIMNEEHSSPQYKRKQSTNSPNYINPLYPIQNSSVSQELDLKDPSRSVKYKDFQGPKLSSTLSQTSARSSTDSDYGKKKAHIRYLQELDSLVKSYDPKRLDSKACPRLSCEKVLTCPARSIADISNDESFNKQIEPSESLDTSTSSTVSVSLTSPLQFSKLLMNQYPKQITSNVKARLDFSIMQ